MICFAKPVLTDDLYIVYHLVVREDVTLRTMTARVQLKKKSLVVSLKGLGAKTN
jgi:hypothetical protein